MAAFSLNSEAFSLTGASILNGTTGAELQPIYGIRTGTLSANTSQFDNTGNDAVLSHWVWEDYAKVTIESGFLPWNMYSLITGSPITSSGTAPNDYYALPLWDRQALNQPTLPVRLRTLSKDSNGAVRTFDIVLYKCQFDPINFTGPSYKTGTVFNAAATALFSNTDEVGNVLTNQCIGRIVSSPGNTTALSNVAASYGQGLAT
jgi:hypothetical protein